jgi:hypothetical protein
MEGMKEGWKEGKEKGAFTFYCAIGTRTLHLVQKPYRISLPS